MPDVINAPNAAYFISTLRHAASNRYSAILDILDNSIDAGATQIKIDLFSRKGRLILIIADDGKGMSRDEIIQAIRLGSERGDRHTAELGKFGVGLSLSSLYLGTTLRVVSQQINREMFQGSQNVDDITRTNTWLNTVDLASPEDQALFNFYLPEQESGTLVIIEGVDRIGATEFARFKNALTAHIGETFCHHIANGLVDFSLSNRLNPEVDNRTFKRVKFLPTEAVDPLMREDEGTDTLDEYTKVFQIEGREVKVDFDIKFLGTAAPQTGSMALNISNQGIYVLRNNRQIVRAKDLGIYVKHNDRNRFRVQINFSPEVDDLFGVTVFKDSVELHPQLAELLKAELEPYAALARVRSQELTAPKGPNKAIQRVDKVVSKLVSTLSGALAGPATLIKSKAKLAAAAGAVLNSKGSKPQNSAEKERKPKTDRTALPKGLQGSSLKFKYEKLGTDQLYTYETTNATGITITFNESHPLVTEIIEDPELLLRFMVASTVYAEQKLLGSEEAGEKVDGSVFEKLAELTSHNLAVLTDGYRNPN